MSIRILVADDSASDVYMLEHALAAAGLECSIVHVDDGDKALDALCDPKGQEAFRLVVLDWYLPKRSGDELLPLIQEAPGAPPCVVLTSGLPPQEAEQLANRGIAVWRKPADLDGYLKLGRTVKELVGSTHACQAERLAADGAGN
ncbi:MAG: response regulator [Bryobacteraceae bacterium]|nr:response regulator [Bryobacteraceae bacterium]